MTQDPPVFFALRPDGSIEELGAAPGYIASLAMKPTGASSTSCPAPTATAGRSGTPLMALDTATGALTAVVELNPLAEAALGLTVGGTYYIALDAERNGSSSASTPARSTSARRRRSARSC